MSLLQKLRNQKLQKAVLTSVMALSIGFGVNNETYAGYQVAGGSANGDKAIAIGSNAVADSDSTIAVGVDVEASDNHALVLGWGSHASNRETIAAGYQADATGNGSTAVGSRAEAIGSFSIALGFSSHAEAERSIAIGRYSYAVGENSLAFGYNSVATENDTVSFGSDGSAGVSNKAFTRRLVNISAGINDTDAANVSQLISSGSYNAETKQLTLSSNSGKNVIVDLSALSSDNPDGSDEPVDLSKNDNTASVVDGLNTKVVANKVTEDKENNLDITEYQVNVEGNGVAEEGNTGLINGDTLYNELEEKADADLGNLTEDGKDVIKDIAKDTVKVEDGLNTTVSVTENADGSVSYQVNVEGNGKAEAGNTGLINGDTLYNTVNEINENITNVTEGINAELDGKANADASNVADHTAEWGAAIGTGKVEAGNCELVTGDTVYEAVKDKADADFGNITEEGKDVIGNIAQEALQDDLDSKANIDASNIETDKWADKLGTGTITAGDTNLVTGDTVYDAIKDFGANSLVTSDGNTITVGKDDSATVIDVSKHNSDGSTENRVITGVATDENDMSSAANVGYVNQSVGQLANNLNRGLSELDSRMKKGVAGAAALAALNPLDYDPENKLNFAAGVGSYKGESATALGMFYRPNENVMFSVGGAFGNGENMWNAGITFNLDKPSTSTSKAAMARAIKTMAADNKALEAKAAEQDAKIELLTAQVKALMKAQEN